MPLIETRTLKGLITLTPLLPTQYTFVLPSQTGTSLPNALDNSALEEVYINVDTTNDSEVVILLPAISKFNNAWNTKIYVNWLAGSNPVRVYPYQGSEVPFIQADNINGAFLIALPIQKSTAYLHIVAPNTWMGLLATNS
jgi:hypothetical protein